MTYDLLSTVEYGGCSAKLNAADLEKALAGLPSTPHKDLLVGIHTHDDAGVIKINEELALIQTTDFFSPVCSDPYEFGEIAAANALSDVYAMGGEVLSVLNIVAFPAGVPMEVLRQILEGGIRKVKEAGGVMMGGHTIVNDVPLYGLAVTGTVHPKKIITNTGARPGDVLLLTKPIGAGIIMAGKRIGEVSDADYQAVLESMKQLNNEAVPLMHKFGVKCATDITGFGLAGHSLKLAQASGVGVRVKASALPVFKGVAQLLDLGCIPGACFRNLEFVEANSRFHAAISYEQKMLVMDAQTSGGLLICCPPENAPLMIDALHKAGYTHSMVIGEVVAENSGQLEVV
jgi:selenide, water dikinase